MSTMPFPKRAAVASGIAVAVAALALAAWTVSHMLLLIFGGILFALLLRALGDALSARTRIPEKWALWVVVVALLALFGLGGWYLSAEIAEQFDELGRSLATASTQMQEWLEQKAWGRYFLTSLSEQEMSSERADMIGRFIAALLAGLSGLVISFFIGLYVAADPTVYRKGLLRLLPLSTRPRIGETLDRLNDTLRAWLLGTFTLMLLVGLVTTIGLWLLGVPLALALGLIAFALEFIPYVGPILAAIPAVLVAGTVSTDHMLYVALLYWGIQSLEGYLLAPLVYQRRVHLPPMLTISAQVVLGALLGVLGIVFATPLTACALVLTQNLYVEDALGDHLEKPVSE